MTPFNAQNEWAAANQMLANPNAKPPPVLAKRRQRRILFIVVGVLVAAGIGAAFAAVSSYAFTSSAKVSSAQQIAGYVIAAAGLTLQFWGVRKQWKRGSGLDYWRGPLMGLTRAQGKQLTDQVRGRLRVQEGTTELSFLQARVMIEQRLSIVSNAGLALLWLGLFIASPAWWRACLAVLFIAVIAAASPFIERNARAAERFVASGD